MRARTSTRLTLDDLTLLEELCLTSSFRPTGKPTYDCRWADWDSYLDAWEQVREAALAAQAAGDRVWSGELFAERVRAFAERHGRAALLGASYEELRRP